MEKVEMIKKLINEIAEYYDEPDEEQVLKMRELTYYLVHEEWPEKKDS